MPTERLFPQQFMHLSFELRDYISRMWKIPRSGISEIRDQTQISDGHTYEDLAVITLDLMCNYIGSQESFARAWELTCAKAYSELHPPVGEIKGEETQIVIPEIKGEETQIVIPEIKGEETQIVIPDTGIRRGRPRNI